MLGNPTVGDSSVVVLTPVKNEAWILERFLAVTSHFADLIIVADQNSSDESVQICRRYPKVIVIKNGSEAYDEAARQTLLIREARRQIPGPKILFALDADEILAANSLGTPGWRSMMKAAPGTVLFFEKPDLYPTPRTCIRYDTPWPLGYIDDGVQHSACSIHSIRIPVPISSKRLEVGDVKVLHYGQLRRDSVRSRQRLYSAVEKVNKRNSLLSRRSRYRPITATFPRHRAEPCPPSWFAEWERLGIDMSTLTFESFYSHDFELLRLFKEHGCSYFWREPVWDCDWLACNREAEKRQLHSVEPAKIKGPSRLMSQLLFLLDIAYDGYREFRRKSRRGG